MTDHQTLVASLNLPVVGHTPVLPVDAIISISGEIFMGVLKTGNGYPSSGILRKHIADAEAFLATVEASATALRDAMQPASVDEIGEQIGIFVTAWPNASGGDLAGYGAQLAQDVIDREPCRHAVRHAIRKLRQTVRFLPSIAEVLAALDEAQKSIRNTAWHIASMPENIEAARAAFAEDERRAALRPPEVD